MRVYTRAHASRCQLGALPAPAKPDEFTGARFRDFGRGTLPPTDRSIAPFLSPSLSLSLISRCFAYAYASSEIKRVSRFRFSDTSIGLKIARTDAQPIGAL